MKKYKFRIWDKDNKFHEGLIKKYKYWTFEVSYRQHTIGSFLIILNRYAEKISELTPQELIALKKVMKIAEKTISKTFNPDKFNYLQLGNGVKHLHFHGIPRYKTERSFAKKIWIDKKYGYPPHWTRQNSSHTLIKNINFAISSNLPHHSSAKTLIKK